MEKTATILLYTLIPFMVIDLCAMSVAVRRNIDTQNQYYKFHENYGVKRTSAIKLLIGCIAVLGLTSSPVMMWKVYFPVIILLLFMGCNFILVMISLITMPTKKTPEGQNKIIPLDSIAGLLVYPFEYLTTKKKFHSAPQGILKWSWAAFLIPEYWYFNNEILGAGYASIALLLAYLSISYEFSVNAAIITILFVRVVSGFIGNRLYFTMYGKWA